MADLLEQMNLETNIMKTIDILLVEIVGSITIKKRGHKNGITMPVKLHRNGR